jgi:hypothetical protein
VKDARAIAEERLCKAREAITDSPSIELAENLPEADHTKRTCLGIASSIRLPYKTRLTEARERGAEAIRAVEAQLGPIENQESTIVVDLFLPYRAVKDFEGMVALFEQLPPPLAGTVMVQGPFAFPLSREGQRERAEGVLLISWPIEGPAVRRTAS